LITSFMGTPWEEELVGTPGTLGTRKLVIRITHHVPQL
jgi:hypothetical protein